MLKRILDLTEGSEWSAPSMRTYQYGSAPMSPGLLRRALGTFGPILQQLYAQTECPQYATLLRKSDHLTAAGRTGDVGRIDADGYLYLVDRLADMVVSGGMNVYSIEVEAALSLHPSVAQVAVIGVPDDEWGERVHAVVVLRDPTAEADLGRHCREHLAAYKRPKGYDIVEALPLTTYGKVDKKALRAPHWAGSSRAVH